MRTRLYVGLLVAGSLLAADANTASTLQASTIAQTGFNDAVGINATGGVDNTPYGNGLDAAGAGVGEPGWTDVWYRPSGEFSVGQTTDVQVHEGDLSLHLIGTGQSSQPARFARFFTEQTSGKVSLNIWSHIEQYSGLANGGTVFYLTGPGGTTTGAPGPGAHAAVVRIQPNGSVQAIGGNGSGGTTITTVFPAGTIQISTWHQIELTADLATQEFNFSVDGVPSTDDYLFRHASAAAPITGIHSVQIYQDALLGYYDELIVSAVVDNPVVPGDFNGDGNVDGADFVIWQTNFPNNSGLATLAMGDANSDGNVDGADFVIWQTNFPTTSASISAVPEPTAWMLMAIGGVFMLARKRK